MHTRNLKLLLLSIFLLFNIVVCYSCDCDVLHPLIEYQNSTLVFKGSSISKTYSSNKKTYTIVMLVEVGFKGVVNNEKVSFEFPSESEYSGTWTSCDITVNVGEQWIIYTHGINNNLFFSSMCSNSRRLDHTKLSNFELDLFQGANTFNFNDYIFNIISFGARTFDTTFKVVETLNYPTPEFVMKEETELKMIVGMEGEILDVFLNNNVVFKNNNIFRFATSISKGTKQPTLFQQKAITILKSLRDWKKLNIVGTNKFVKYEHTIFVKYNPIGFEWNFYAR